MKMIHTKRGLSIVEMLVLVAVFGLVMIAVASSVLFFYRTNSNTVEQAFAINSARKGVQSMVRDIRETAYSDAGAFPVIAIATSTFTFYSDVDRDDSVERIRYFLDDTVLRKGVTNATGDPPAYVDANEVISLVSDNVRNTAQMIDTFSYFTATGTQITNFADVTDVAFVDVHLIVNINPSRLPEEFTLRGSATLRNLKTNL